MRAFLFLSLVLYAWGADPDCSRGVASADRSVCCPSSCGQCGGGNCDQKQGGYYSCCVGGVAASGRSCGESDAPCKLSAPSQSWSGGDVRRKTMVGIHAGPPVSSIYERQSMYNVKLDSTLLYMPVNYLKWSYIAKHLDAGMQVQLVIEFHDSFPNLRAIGDGRYDSQLRDFARSAKRDGRFIWIRPLHEFNGDWYPWGVFRGGDNSVSNFKRAFRHVVEVLRGEDINAKFQLPYNVKSPWGRTSDSMMSFYPGGDVVDMICVSAYNMFGIGSNTDTSPKSFKELFQGWYGEMVGTGKDLCISETNGSRYIWNKAEYIREAWKSMARDFPRLTTITWFLENKIGSGGKDEGFDFNTQDEINAFRDGLNEFRSITGGRGDQGIEEVASAEEIMAVEEERLEYERELDEIGLTVSAHEPRADVES